MANSSSKTRSLRRGQERAVVVLALLTATVLALGCDRERPVPAPAAADTIVLTDTLGRSVTLARAASRIVSLSPALTEALFAVGCGDRLVLRDGWSDFPVAARAVVSVQGFAPSAEAILAVRPDLVLTTFPPAALRSALDAAGVPWLGWSPVTLDHVAGMMADIGRACGAPGPGADLAATFRTRLAAIERTVAGRPRPRVFYEMDAGGGRPFTVSRLAFGHAVLTAAGGENAFASADVPWFQVSTEAVLAADPDLILLADADAADQPQSAAAVAARPGWSALRAVREGRVVPLSIDLVSRPGPRLVDGVAQIARALHPDAAWPAGPGPTAGAVRGFPQPLVIVPRAAP